MATTTATKPCIRCHQNPRVTDLHCASCDASVRREQAKIAKLIGEAPSQPGERIVLRDPAYTVVSRMARAHGWVCESDDENMRTWVRQ